MMKEGRAFLILSIYLGRNKIKPGQDKVRKIYWDVRPAVLFMLFTTLISSFF